MCKFLRAFPIVLALVAGFAVPAGAQCQLVVDDVAPQQENIDFEAVTDLSVLDGIDIYSAELSEIPEHAVQLYLILAGQAYTAGDYERAAQAYLYALSCDRDKIMLYNLACCYGLLDEAALATKYLQMSWDLGYRDVEWIRQDMDFDPVRDDEGFSALMEEFEAETLAAAGEPGEDVYFAAETLFKGRLTLPDNYDPARSYLLIVGLHGAMDTTDRFGTLGGYFNTQDFIYVAPQGPYAPAERDNGGWLWFGTIPEEEEQMRDWSVELNKAYVAQVITEMKERYNVSGVYLLGFSQGAEMSYITGMSDPDMIDGIVVFGGRLHPDFVTPELIENGAGLRVFIAHGRQDNFRFAQEAFDTLEAAGYDVELCDFEGGHYIHLDTLRAAEEWMHP